MFLDVFVREPRDRDSRPSPIVKEHDLSSIRQLCELTNAKAVGRGKVDDAVYPIEIAPDPKSHDS
jgi:hypothetical protein